MTQYDASIGYDAAIPWDGVVVPPPPPPPPPTPASQMGGGGSTVTFAKRPFWPGKETELEKIMAEEDFPGVMVALLLMDD